MSAPQGVVAWTNVVPGAAQRQVEQDLIIRRALAEVVPDQVLRGRLRFRGEPVRSLDALQLPTALAVRNLSPEVQIPSFDDRIRDNATAPGLDVVPETGAQPPCPG